jgi:hypothetical protein
MSQQRAPSPLASDERAGRAILYVAVAAFVAVSLPVLWRGAPLADDFNNCVAPAELGVRGFMAASWHQLGAVRPARFLEILLGAAVCPSLPFGIAILVSLFTTLAVSWVLRAALRDLGTPRPWANVGAALWLFQPLGTETGLWPAALHVPLGLALALVAVRLYRSGRYGWGGAANLAAALSVEQVIFPMPLVAWMVAPAARRRATLGTSLAVGAAAIVAFVLLPGANPRLHTAVLDRLAGLAANPTFYVAYPAVGLGMHSIPMAVWWARPWSVVVLLAGALGGLLAARPLAFAAQPQSRQQRLRVLVGVAGVIALTNVVVVLAVPQQGSPRVFAPTWLVLVAAAAWLAGSSRWRRATLVGSAAGLFAAGAVLSLVLSVSVRLRSADFTQRAAGIVAARVPEGGRVAVCQVPRTVVSPAPRGAFAVHEFIYDWAAERAVTYYTGRHATIYIAGALWDVPCPSAPKVDAVIEFDELLNSPQ